MHQLQRRLSPALLIAFAALFIALSGTALAQSGLIITSSNQVAEQAISNFNIKNESISDVDLRDPQLKVRVSKDAQTLGSGDGRVVRAPNTTKGVYDITFDSGALNANDGTETDTVVSENCTINVTSRAGSGTFDAFPATYLVRTTGPNTVRVSATNPANPGAPLVDTAFDLTASC